MYDSQQNTLYIKHKLVHVVKINTYTECIHLAILFALWLFFFPYIFEKLKWVLTFPFSLWWACCHGYIFTLMRSEVWRAILCQSLYCNRWRCSWIGSWLTCQTDEKQTQQISREQFTTPVISYCNPLGFPLISYLFITLMCIQNRMITALAFSISFFSLLDFLWLTFHCYIKKVHKIECNHMVICSWISVVHNLFRFLLIRLIFKTDSPMADTKYTRQHVTRNDVTNEKN